MDETVILKNIIKKFPGTVANDNVTVSIKKGSIHGIIGENGAGKTTLMKQLYGMYKPDKGEIIVNGKSVDFSSPKDAINEGIGMVHQHFTLVPSMSVFENIILGRPPEKYGFIDIKKAKQEVEALCNKYNFEMDIDATVKELPVGLKQRIEILKALYLGANILILDEPTAVLTPQEITAFFDTLIDLRKQGSSIILITHKLSEVIAITDEVTVLRDGKVTGHVLTKDTDEQKLANMMVGRGMLLRVNKRQNKEGDIGLKLKNVNCKNNDGIHVLNNISLNVHYGEIVGIAGVQGNGQTELIDVITGLNNDYGGDVFIDETRIQSKDSPWERRKIGLGHIPEDRQITGSASSASVEDNFLMTTYKKPELNRKGFISRAKIRKQLEYCIESFRIKIPTLTSEANSLSGGNMQKLIFAREYNLNPKVLIAAQPTRGVDIGAMEFIHNRLIDMKETGKAILLISNELSEIMTLSDRILVMYNGGFIGEVMAEDATEEMLGLMMAGIKSRQDKEG